jgi:hypothetical protein
MLLVREDGCAGVVGYTGRRWSDVGEGYGSDIDQPYTRHGSREHTALALSEALQGAATHASRQRVELTGAGGCGRGAVAATSRRERWEAGAVAAA